MLNLEYVDFSKESIGQYPVEVVEMAHELQTFTGDQAEILENLDGDTADYLFEVGEDLTS